MLTILLNSCFSTNKMANESIHNAIIGQDEMIVCNRLGMPTKVEYAGDGEKIIIYEHYSESLYPTPNNSAITYNTAKNVEGNRPGLTFTSNVNTAANDSKYAIYPRNASYLKVSYLKVYLDKQGNAIKIEQNIPQEQLEIYHERFKHFLPKE